MEDFCQNSKGNYLGARKDTGHRIRMSREKPEMTPTPVQKDFSQERLRAGFEKERAGKKGIEENGISKCQQHHGMNRITEFNRPQKCA